MDIKRIHDLAIELIDWVNVAHEEAEMVDVKMVDEELFFIHDGDNEYINPKHLPLAKQFEIKQLAKFVRLYRDVDEDSLRLILAQNATKFQLLRDVQETVPNLVEEIRSTNDNKKISYLYAVHKMYPHTKENGLGL